MPDPASDEQAQQSLSATDTTPSQENSTPRQESSQNEVFPSTQEEAPVKKSAVALHIEALTRDLVAAVNARNFDLNTYPWNPHCSSSFTCDLQRPPETGLDFNLTSADQAIAWLQFLNMMFPEFRVRVTDVNAYVDEAAGKAIVYFSSDMDGLAIITNSNLCMVEWRRYGSRVEGVWKALVFHGLRGPPSSVGL